MRRIDGHKVPSRDHLPDKTPQPREHSCYTDTSHLSCPGRDCDLNVILLHLKATDHSAPATESLSSSFSSSQLCLTAVLQGAPLSSTGAKNSRDVKHKYCPSSPETLLLSTCSSSTPQHTKLGKVWPWGIKLRKKKISGSWFPLLFRAELTGQAGTAARFGYPEHQLLRLSSRHALWQTCSHLILHGKSQNSACLNSLGILGLDLMLHAINILVMIIPSCALHGEDSQKRMQTLWRTTVQSRKDGNSYVLYFCGEKKIRKSFRLEKMLRIIKSNC